MSENVNQRVGGETAKVASYILGTKYEDLPAEVVVKAKQHILDTLGAMVSGVRLPAGKLIVEFARSQPRKKESTVIGSDFKTTSITASLANGTLAHADETDDVYHPTSAHPGCAAVPATLAMAEREQVDGKGFINAIVLGYDIVCRLGRAMDVRHMKNGRGMPACFAAAAIASRLLRLSKEQVCSALGLAGEQASGTHSWLQEPLHMAKAFELGVAARNGVTAALLAQLDFQGPPAIFEGPNNIFDAYSVQPNLMELTENLGGHHDVMGVEIKKYPVGGPIQAPLEGLFQIMQEQKLQAEDIQEIIVGAAQHSVWLVSNRPIQDISLEYMVAAGACYGKVGWEEAHPESRLRDPKVQDFKKRIRFVADARLEKTHPRTRAATVEIVTTDGSRHSITVEHIPGSPQKPFTQAQVEEKFLGLASPVLGFDKAHGVVRVVSSLEQLKDVSEMGNLLRV